MFLPPLVWWTMRSHTAQLSHASPAAPPLPVICIVPHQAPALGIYRAGKDKGQAYLHTQGLRLKRGQLQSRSALHDSPNTPSRPSDELTVLSFEKKFKVCHLQSSSGLTLISREEDREQRRQPGACTSRHKQSTQQLWQSSSSSYTYCCYPSNSGRKRNEVKTGCVYKNPILLAMEQKAPGEGKEKS